MLAIRTVRARNDTAKARQTNPTAASLAWPACKEVGLAAAEAVSGLRILYAICLRREQQKPRDYPGLLMLGRNRRLFQRGVDRGELGVQGGTKAVDRGDNRQRNAGGNQAVFNRGRAGLILHETRNKVLHS